MNAKTSKCPTVSELSEIIGREGLININGLSVPVTVVDVRIRGGRIDYCVSIDGTSRSWVLGTRVELDA